MGRNERGGVSCERGLTHARPARSADHPSESPSGKLSQVKVTQRPLNKTPSPRKTLVMPWHPQRGSGALPGVRLQTLCWFAHQSAVCSGYVPAELYLHLPHRQALPRPRCPRCGRSIGKGWVLRFSASGFSAYTLQTPLPRGGTGTNRLFLRGLKNT